MARGRDWITPRINGVRYVDQPPLLHWLVSASFGAAGVTPFAARLWPALAAVGCAALTARLGVALGGPAPRVARRAHGRREPRRVRLRPTARPELLFVFGSRSRGPGSCSRTRRPPAGARRLLRRPRRRDARPRLPRRARRRADHRRVLLAHARAARGPVDSVVGRPRGRRDRGALVSAHGIAEPGFPTAHGRRQPSLRLHASAPGSRRGRAAGVVRLSRPGAPRLPTLGARAALGARARLQAAAARRARATLAPARALVGGRRRPLRARAGDPASPTLSSRFRRSRSWRRASGTKRSRARPARRPPGRF